ncbi:MAG: ribosomal L7Ae/L30e/S12e/Gadd45 family protein, partial [Phascolarctobacterium sp.]|nr:ribosomal L7Ae/L30e/S12e/Gadd45 family protein [Phascolarctobacterium sp.]
IGVVVKYVLLKEAYMLLKALMEAAKRIVGIKQTEKAVAKGIADRVYIACDADERITGKLRELCMEKNVEVSEVESMDKLGKVCGISVKAAVAAILKN